MRDSLRFALIFIVAFCLSGLIEVRIVDAATSPIVLTVSSDVQTVVADGHSRANIVVQAWVDQSLYTGTMQLLVQSSMGDMEPANVTLSNGSAWTHLRSGAGVGTAQVTVQVVSASQQVILPSPLLINFVAPGTRAAPTVNRRYMTLRASDLSFDVASHQFTGIGHAKVSFEGLNISADAAYVDAASLELRAQTLSEKPVVVTLGKQSISVNRLYINFQQGTGAALLMRPDGALDLVGFTVNSLKTYPLSSLQPRTAFTFYDVNEKSVLVRARRMDFYPGNEIRCAGASFWVSGKCVFALPYYRLSLNPFNPTQDQYITYDTYTGIGINIPIYYQLTDTEMGTVCITHQQQTGYVGTATQTGWAVGIRQVYGQAASGAGGAAGTGGTVTLDRITSPSWGASWTQNDRFGQADTLSTYLYTPDHQAFTGNLSFYAPVRGMGMSFTTFGNHQIGYDSSSSQFTTDFPARSFLNRRLTVNLSSSLQYNYEQNRATSPNVYSQSLIPGTGANIYGAPWILDRTTSVVPSISTHYFWPATGGYQSSNAGLSLNRRFGATGGLSIAYNWSSTGSTGIVPGYTSQILSGNWYKSFGPRLQLNINPSYTITSDSLQTYSTVMYSLLHGWSLDMVGQFASGASASFNDWQIGISRSLFARSLRLYYEGLTHQIRFEVIAGQY